MDLPPDIAARVASFDELIPGVPASEVVLSRILRRLCTESSITISFDNCSAELWYVCRASKQVLSGCVVVNDGFAGFDREDECVYTKDYTQSATGLFNLLIELREIVGLVREGCCLHCNASTDSGGVRLVSGGKCVACVLSEFLGG